MRQKRILPPCLLAVSYNLSHLFGSDSKGSWNKVRILYYFADPIQNTDKDYILDSSKFTFLVCGLVCLWFALVSCKVLVFLKLVLNNVICGYWLLLFLFSRHCIFSGLLLHFSNKLIQFYVL